MKFAPTMIHVPLRSRNTSAPGFTLVEVLLTLGVLAFAMIPLVGLMPIGLHQAREAMNLTVVSQIGQRLVMEANESNLATLEGIAAGAGLQFDGQGNLTTESGRSAFRATYTFQHPANGNSAAGEISARLNVTSQKFRVLQIEILNLAAPRDVRNPVVFTALVSGEDR